jgi:uncharacterized membrane protein YkvA (DUF1232 family)
VKGFLAALRERARALKLEVGALYFAARDPQTPWCAKAVVALVVAYALSPIDLIPDFIPVLGYLDDLVLLPAGIALARRLVPASVMARCRARAEVELAGRRLVSKAGAFAIAAIWSIIVIVIIIAVARALGAVRGAS